MHSHRYAVMICMNSLTKSCENSPTNCITYNLAESYSDKLYKCVYYKLRKRYAYNLWSVYSIDNEDNMPISLPEICLYSARQFSLIAL